MERIFSIIVPVYNVANYLDKAIESILSQTISRDVYEVILVDDGSTDNSGIKCDTWRNKNPDLIKVIHKENGGLGFARNSGLEMASGEYIIFLDSDDYWIDNDALGRFVSTIKKDDPDVIVFKNCIYDEETGLVKEPKKDRKEKIRLEDAVKLEYFDFSAWNKVVKKSLLVNNNINFKKGISEDMLWSYKILLCAKKISFCLEKSVYAYRKGRSGSLTAQKCDTYREEYFQIMDDIGNIMKLNKKNRIADLYASTVYITLFRYLRNNLNLNEKDTQFVLCLDRNKRMLRHCANRKISIIRFLIYVIGAQNTILLFKRVHR
ncbi:MAG: glycosyltransferase family A protein [Anaerobutyricum hallii]|uniref:glycosyltransferase family 2 protein n=1 Tax=Anaerobutyricum hallii TaxID=39488 RepID=UPI002A82F43C|nr:glycosyltransferase family A protein [Anaerobutyricum hallii]MDY4576590.1 glycosyltransferase family A protein [Anaerobutyricum hallii]